MLAEGAGVKITRGLLLPLLMHMPLPASAECIDWRCSELFVDIENARVVVEGVVERVDPTGADSCPLDRVVFGVSRVWKGEPAKEYVLLNDNLRPAPGRTCPLESLDSAIFRPGERYIVFALGPVDDLRAMGCSTRRAANDKGTKCERRRLARWKASKVSSRR
jgi:hypothetical protein